MATLTNVEALLNGGVDVGYEDGSATQTFEYGVADEKLVVLINNTDAVNDALTTFVAGDFVQNGYGDQAISVPAGATVLCEVESGIVKDANGEVTLELTDPDGTAFTGAVADIKVAVVELK
jgi:hypothetical protein